MNRRSFLSALGLAPVAAALPAAAQAPAEWMSAGSMQMGESLRMLAMHGNRIRGGVVLTDTIRYTMTEDDILGSTSFDGWKVNSASVPDAADGWLPGLA